MPKNRKDRYYCLSDRQCLRVNTRMKQTFEFGRFGRRKTLFTTENDGGGSCASKDYIGMYRM